jgi:uncharacterized membrane protein
MPLRHSDKPTPSWLLLCAGPMLVIFGLVFTSFAVLVQSQTPVLKAALTIAVCILLVWGGIQLTREYTWPRIKRVLGRRGDRTDGEA